MGEIKNMGASVRARLLNKAKAERRDPQELLQYFVMERFLYRLATSELCSSFLLKGALLLSARLEVIGRATRDIDFSGNIGNDPDELAAAVRKICEQRVEEDGVHFDTTSLDAQRIVLQDEYSGVRIRFRAQVENAELPMRIDIGIGDEVYPGADRIEYPTLLDFPPPILNCYPLTSIVAEKLEALLSLGLANTRLKDYFDLLVMARQFEFKGAELSEAVRRTCSTRGTRIETVPVGLSDEFVQERDKDWQGILQRTGMAKQEFPERLREATAELQKFLLPLLRGATLDDWEATWKYPEWITR